MSPSAHLRHLRDAHNAIWVERLHGWLADPHDIAAALSSEGFQEYKLEVLRSQRDHHPVGGLWQGLDGAGSVASVIWINNLEAHQAIVFVDIDGQQLQGERNEAGGENWWSDLDEAVLGCLAEGPLEPAEIGRRLGVSEEAAASLVTLLAQQGKVRICLVAATALHTFILRVHSFWCPFRRQPVMAEFREDRTGRRRVAVEWCSAFAPPTSIACARHCLELDRLPVAAESARASELSVAERGMP